MSTDTPDRDWTPQPGELVLVDGEHPGILLNDDPADFPIVHLFCSCLAALHTRETHPLSAARSLSLSSWRSTDEPGWDRLSPATAVPTGGVPPWFEAEGRIAFSLHAERGYEPMSTAGAPLYRMKGDT